MIVSIIAFLIVFVFRIVMGYLATRFDFLESWLIYITILVCILAVVMLALIIAKIKKAFSSNKNKKE